MTVSLSQITVISPNQNLIHMLARVNSGALVGINAFLVEIEVNCIEENEPRTIIVGLPDTAVKESQDRVAAALKNSGKSWPLGRTTINLAPGTLRKEGPCYDLPIALGLLAATNQMHAPELSEYVIAGELSLSGATRPIKGGLALALMAREQKKRGVLLPAESAYEAALVEDIAVYPIETLDHAVKFLTGELLIKPIDPHHTPFLKLPEEHQHIDFSEIKGQHNVIRAIEVSVAGGHNLIMIGPPGSGKSMMSKRIPTIMPNPTLNEFLEILSIQSAAGTTLTGEHRSFRRPFRAPHHTISDVGLLGGGNPPGPGEISLAHHGILFLDELPEFKRSTLEVLRQPLEDGSVTISRSMGKITLPCSIMLVAAMNPCPCGYLGDTRRECRCSPITIQRYRSRISGPLLDRIDIHIEAPALPLNQMNNSHPGESSKTIQSRINAARSLQSERFKNFKNISCNAHMNHRLIREHCVINTEDTSLLQKSMEELSLSARAYDRILKVARTIADLANSLTIERSHLLEAIQYRSLDRTLFY